MKLCKNCKYGKLDFWYMNKKTICCHHPDNIEDVSSSIFEESYYIKDTEAHQIWNVDGTCLKFKDKNIFKRMFNYRYLYNHNHITGVSEAMCLVCGHVFDVDACEQL